MSRILLILGFVILSFGCSKTPKEEPKQIPQWTERAAVKGLSSDQAAQRARRVSDVAYNMLFALSSDPTFSGMTVINFNLNNKDFPLTIDFLEGSIKTIEVN